MPKRVFSWLSLPWMRRLSSLSRVVGEIAQLEPTVVAEAEPRGSLKYPRLLIRHVTKSQIRGRRRPESASYGRNDTLMARPARQMKKAGD
jgi:hypothetical protein